MNRIGKQLAWGAAAACILAVSASAAHAADTVWNHNGSEMLWHAQGDARVISYLHPRSGLSVVTGTILFEGRRVGGTMEGMARIFRQGCPPAEYFVSGPVLSETEVVLYGAAPIRASSGCAISGYSTDSSNATLRFSYLRAATAADTAINRVDAAPVEDEPEAEPAGRTLMPVALPGGAQILVEVQHNVASHVMPDMVEAVLICPPGSFDEPVPIGEFLADDGTRFDILLSGAGAHVFLVDEGELNVCAVDDVSADLIDQALIIDASQYDHGTAACAPVQFAYSYAGLCDPRRGTKPQTRR